MTTTPTQDRRRPISQPRVREDIPDPRRDTNPGDETQERGLVARSIKARSVAPLMTEARVRATAPLVPVWDAAREKLIPVVHAGGAIVLTGCAGQALAVDGSSTGAMALATVVAGPATWYGSRRLVERQMPNALPEQRSKARRFIAVVSTATAGWLTSAAAFGADPSSTGGKINLTVGALLGLWAASPYVRFRNQPKFVPPPPPPPPVIEPEEPEREQEPMGFALSVAKAHALWQSNVALNSGALPATRIEPDSMEEIKGGWKAVIAQEVPGSFGPEKWVPATGRVAAAFQIGVQDITIEPAAGDASKAELTVLHDNPLTNFQIWPGPYAVLTDKDGEEMRAFDTDRGVALIGVHADGELVRYRFWNSGGAVHDLISGATGSGKSEFVNQLLGYERHAVVEVPVLDDDGTPKVDDEGNVIKVKKGLVVSRIGDPQWGQSFGDWQDHVDWFAPTIDEIRIMLTKTEREMYARNKDFGRKQWWDEKRQVWRRGVKNFTPTPEMPLIVITIDEAHEVLKDMECARIVAVLGKMGRKVGIKLRLITQVPLLQELGNNMAIRDAVASGNVVVFRTANALSGQVAFNGALPAQPNTIPREWPKGRAKPGQEITAGLGYALGASARPAIMRAFYPGDAVDWILKDGEDWGLPGELDPLTRAAGIGYEDRHQRLSEMDDMEAAPAGPSARSGPRAIGMTCEQAMLEMFLSRAGQDYQVKLEEIPGLLGGNWKPRMISKVLNDWRDKGWSISGKPRLPHGVHQLTPKGREEAPAELQREDMGEDPVADERRMVARQ